MKRKRRNPEAVAVSLFPFLAVLLCTMGALIVLLVILALQARDPVEVAEPPPPEDTFDEDAFARFQQLTAKAEELETERDDLIKTIDARELLLSDIEMEGTRLEEELESLEAYRGQLRSSAESNVTDEQLQANLVWYENRLFELENELRKFRHDVESNPVSYAIIPYTGESGTYRRPIYIECTEDGVVLQPEGVVLHADDFTVLAANNPLVSALRETTDYWRMQGRSARGDVYPLLLVRPNGALAFHAAKAALDFWSGDFGYELIEGEWNLEYAQPDEELARRQARAVDNARRMLANLRRGQSALLAQATQPSFRVSSQGGSLEAVSPGLGGGGRGGSAASGGSDNGFAATGGGADVGSTGPGSRGGNSAFGGDGGFDPPGSRYAMNNAGGMANGGGANGEATNGGAANLGTSFGSTGAGHKPNQVTGGAVTQDGQTTTYLGGANPANESQFRYGASGGASSSRAVSNGTAMQQGSLTQSVTGAATPRMPTGVNADANSAHSMAGGYQPGGQQAGGQPGQFAAAQNAGSFSYQGAGSGGNGSSGSGGGSGQHREENWAIPNIGVGDVPVSRTIRVTLDARRMTIYPRDPQWDPHTVQLAPQTIDSLDAFRLAVWNEMDRWGMAGRGMYWKPVLKFEVTPDGADRYFEFKQHMENSGFVLESRRVAGAFAGQSRAGQPRAGQPTQTQRGGPRMIYPGQR